VPCAILHEVIHAATCGLEPGEVALRHAGERDAAGVGEQVFRCDVRGVGGDVSNGICFSSKCEQQFFLGVSK
jgi:hypothetical protein